MTRNVSFTAQNWESIYTFNATAGILSENTYIPIPPATAPIFLESDIIAVYVNTDVPDGRNWRYGGFVEQRFTSGLTVGGSADAAGSPHNIYINKITTLFFPPITAQYSLKVYFPKWFKSVELQLWQYTGVDDTSENITLTEEFANINFKIDQLSSKL
ncbi:hypothetical protein FJR11_04385 [Anabaena sp. UHCC 0187]|uniref:hypothetical protein n=1 Tax=Anabaena sp. UHCC 0187 TaxID=2590018 RepID=UPI001444B94F|nr:hypothetical protein [Anabaena sp. UHCC 0187]MTJ11845.1 hypothetical protein [Anabaena sp. UHCC 0187]